MEFLTPEYFLSERPRQRRRHGSIGFLLLFLLVTGSGLWAQQAPNCSNFSPAIDGDGNAYVSAGDFVTNIDRTEFPVRATVLNQWGGVLDTFYFEDDEQLVEWNVCSYLGKSFAFAVENEVGKCNLGQVDLNGTPPPELISALQSGFLDEDGEVAGHIGQNKMVVYCGLVPGISDPRYRPDVKTACDYKGYRVQAQPDWVMMPGEDGCGENDTAEIIFRTWEILSNNDNLLTTMVDTIVVMRLPKLTQASFVGDKVDTVVCTPMPIPQGGFNKISYNAWKQTTGIHDYELPYIKLRYVVYDLPMSILALEKDGAEACGRLDVYMDQVIIKKQSGKVLTIGDLPDYTAELTNPASGLLTGEQLDFLYLHFGGAVPSPEQFVLLEIGDEVLSEDGTFVTVTEDWFYNGHGRAPFWFSGGWPSVCGGGDCVSYCDFSPAAEKGCVRISVPRLSAEAGFSEDCDTICLPQGKHCGIIVDRSEQTETGDCPSYVSGTVRVTQTCWAATATECGGNGEIVSAWEQFDNNGDGQIDKQYFDLYQKTYHVDNIPPIFDFCYPESCEGPMTVDTIYLTGQDGADTIILDTTYIGPADYIARGEQFPCAEEWEQAHATVYTTLPNDCAAEIFVPDVKLIDNCSGIDQVKARIPSTQRMVELELTATDTLRADGEVICVIYTYSHTENPIRLPFNGCDGALTEVIYEAADGCWNQSSWKKYIEVRDETPPTVITNHDVNVRISERTEWVYAHTYNEGSWDNCAIDLELVRRSDWASDTACVDLCDQLDTAPTSWVEILTILGIDPGQAAAAVNGNSVGAAAFRTKYNINALEGLLENCEVEHHYFKEVSWLWSQAGPCGEKVVHSWLFELAKQLAEDCSEPDILGNVLNPRDLLRIFDFLFDESGYGGELSQIGGGWARMVPFNCGDVCGDVATELLLMDYCCNWNIGSTTTFVEELGFTRVIQELPDLSISCEAYSQFYKDIAESASRYNSHGGSAADSTGAYDLLDQAFGKYISTWVDNQGRPVDINGNLLPLEELEFFYRDVSCYEESWQEKVQSEGHDGQIFEKTEWRRQTNLDTTDHTARYGILSIGCSATYTQDVWLDVDECGEGRIVRRFFINTGCGENAPPKIEVHQTITVESSCPMQESMFDVPEQIGTVNQPICLPQALSKDYMPDTIGALVEKSHLAGKLCNSFAIGYDVIERNMSGRDGMKQFEVVWSVVDWCCAYDSPDRELVFRQKVMAVIDPDCNVDTDSGEAGTNLVHGKVATEKGNPIEKVAIQTVSGTGSPGTTVTTDDGSYSISVDGGRSVSLIPGKNTGFAEGITTRDLVEIHRHILNKKSLEGQYRRIAADVNGNGAVDPFDMLELRNLILNPDLAFGNNTSWRFFDKKNNREVYDISNLSGDVTVDWVGVKIGDVDMSLDEPKSSRIRSGVLQLNVDEKPDVSMLEAGKSYKIPVTSADFKEMTGMQFTLSYLADHVTLEAIEPGVLELSKNNYYRYAPGLVTMSWHDAAGRSAGEDEVLFSLVLRAQKGISLRDAISLNGRVADAEAYDVRDGLKDVRLKFDRDGHGFALFQNTPNPYDGETVIGFRLPEASSATLSVYDVNGRLLKVTEGSYEQGYNEVTLKASDLGVSGILFYQLDTKTYVATRKMVIVR